MRPRHSLMAVAVAVAVGIAQLTASIPMLAAQTAGFERAGSTVAFGDPVADDFAAAATLAPDGTLLVLGATAGSWFAERDGGRGTVSALDDLFVAQLDATASMGWSVQLGTDRTDVPRALARGRDGTIFVAGHSGLATMELLTGDAPRPFLAALDADGQERWRLGIEARSIDGLVATGDEVMAVTGTDEGVVLIHLDGAGGVLLRALVQESLGYRPIAVATTDSRFYLGVSSRAGGPEVWAFSLDPPAAPLWRWSSGAPHLQLEHLTGRGDRLVVTGTLATAERGQDVFAVWLDLDGALVGTQTVDNPGDDERPRVALDHEGNMLLAMTVRSPVRREVLGPSDVVLLAWGPDRLPLGSAQTGSPSPDEVAAVVVGFPSNYVIGTMAGVGSQVFVSSF